jgi:uncharacterized protein (UPF0335 family)
LSEIGHNGQLKSFVERIESLEAEKKALATDIRDVYAEAKDDLDVKVLRRVIRERAKDQTARKIEEVVFAEYWALLNMGDLT